MSDVVFHTRLVSFHQDRWCIDSFFCELLRIFFI